MYPTSFPPSILIIIFHVFFCFLIDFVIYDSKVIIINWLLINHVENIGGFPPVLDSVDWAKPSRDYLALAFQGFVSFIVCDKALGYLKTRSLVADVFIILIMIP